MRYFDSDEFKEVLSLYENSRREGSSCYLDTDYFIDISDYYLDNNRSDDALEVIEMGLRQHPDDDTLKCVRAGVMIYQHRFSEAEVIVEELDADKNYDVKYLLGQLAYGKEHDIEKAEKFFHEWLDDVNMEWNYDAQEDEEDIPSDFDDDPDEDEEYDEDKPESQLRDSYVHIIMSYLELADIDHKSVVRKWIEAYVEKFSPLGAYNSDYAIADIVRDNSLNDLGVKIFSQLLDYDPYIPGGWTLLAAAQYMTGDFEEAINSVDFALAVDPQDAEAWNIKGNCHYSLRNDNQALDCFNKFTELTGSHFTDMQIACCYTNLNNPGMAIPYLNNVLNELNQMEGDIDEQRAWKYYEVAQVYFLCDVFDKASETLTLVEELLKEEPDYHLLKGSILLASGDFQNAVEHFSFVMSHSSHLPTTLVTIGARFLAFNYSTAAVELLESAMQLVQHDDPLFVNRGFGEAYLSLAYYNLGDAANSLKWMKTTCKENPEAAKVVFRAVFPEDLDPSEYIDYIMNLSAKSSYI